MNIIKVILFFLLLTPIYWVLTDITIGKIKNYFIFPLLLLSFTLTFFIENFYQNRENIIWIIILITFSYLFYKNNRWWAGDWKYLILIWINSIIISFLKWFQVNIINYLFLMIFSIIFVYNIVFLIIKINEIKNIKYSNLFKFNILNDIWLIFMIYITSFFISQTIWDTYRYISIFLFILLIFPLIKNFKNKFIYYMFIIIWLWISIYYKDYISPITIWIIFFLFSFLQSFFEKIYDIIDIKTIKIMNMKQWNILTPETIKIIKNDTKLNYLEAPLQWNEVFEIIWFYKNNNKNINITIYKEIKLWIIIYLWYFISIIYLLSK